MSRFQIGWRAKALIYMVLDAAPFGTRIYQLLQRHVTKTIPRRLAPTAETARWFLEGFAAIRRHGPEDVARARFLELGAGWDLYGNFVLWCCGVNHQVALDIRRLASADQIDHVIRHLQSNPPPGAVRSPSWIVKSSDFPDELFRVYGIEYLAPADATATGMESGTIDAVVTTSVLEHIPFGQLPGILAECHRLMHAGSVMSHVIDYSDHYSHSDPSISRYNFLRFTDSEWARFNPGLHFQNRGRHREYRELFLNAGFQIVSERTEQPADAERQLAAIEVAGRFKSMPIADLAPTTGHFILKKKDR